MLSLETSQTKSYIFQDAVQKKTCTKLIDLACSKARLISWAILLIAVTTLSAIIIQKERDQTYNPRIQLPKGVNDIPEKTVWLYWNTPIEKAPQRIKDFKNRWNESMMAHNWTVTMLSNANILDYVFETELCDNFFGRLTMYASHNSDCVRAAIMAKYGGIYIDISAVTTTKHAKLLDIAWNNLHTMNKVDAVISTDIVGEIRNNENNLYVEQAAWFVMAKRQSTYMRAFHQNMLGFMKGFGSHHEAVHYSDQFKYFKTKGHEESFPQEYNKYLPQEFQNVGFKSSTPLKLGSIVPKDLPTYLSLAWFMHFKTEYQFRHSDAFNNSAPIYRLFSYCQWYNGELVFDSNDQYDKIQKYPFKVTNEVGRWAVLTDPYGKLFGDNNKFKTPLIKFFGGGNSVTLDSATKFINSSMDVPN